MLKNLDKLEDLIDEEIGRIIRKGDMTPAELDAATKAICLVEKIKMLKEIAPEDEMYSEMPYSERTSYRNRSRQTGRYTSYRPSMSRERGYSGHSIKDRMIDRLESMMDEAQSEHEKEVVMTWIDRLNSGE